MYSLNLSPLTKSISNYKQKKTKSVRRILRSSKYTEQITKNINSVWYLLIVINTNSREFFFHIKKINQKYILEIPLDDRLINLFEIHQAQSITKHRIK